MMSAPAAPDLLATILAATRRAVEIRQARVPVARLEPAPGRRGAAAFAAALRDGRAPRVIAECKRRSPSRGVLRADYRPAAHAASYAAAGAAAISVLTEPTFFDGSLDDLRVVRSAVSVPLLRKDFICSAYQVHEAAAAGADAVLLIVAALSREELARLLREAASADLAVLVEVHDTVEAQRAIDAGAAIVGVNSRNLRTLSVDPAVHDAVAHAVPASITRVAESGLRASGDLHRLQEIGYDAFLVGERLIVEADPGEALRRLRGSPA
ncbi:MAG TPA: indole-3-glycerol phosphate synthase TrpC [Vicinamibacterales bacterium]|nr:indole-3-glycerol phosphate synthase TrpC [Vicinamibacterales bacterium]